MKCLTLLLAVLFLLSGCQLIRSSSHSTLEPDWQMFQKDTAHAGVSSAPAVESPEVLWKTYIGIQGYLNNPVLAEGRVFSGSSGKEHNLKDKYDDIYCLDAKTGRIKWHRRTDNDACGVAYDRGRIFSTGDDSYLRAFKASNGLRLWKIKRKGKLYCQPLVMNGMVIVGDSDGTIVALDQRTGRIRWSVSFADGTIRGSLTSDGENIYAAFLGGTIVCLNYSGRVIWVKSVGHQTILDGFKEIYGAPTIAGNLLIIGYARDTYYDNPAFIAIDKSSGDIAWQARDAGRKRGDSYGNIRSSAAIWKEYFIYGEPYSNDLVALNAAKGNFEWKVSIGTPMFPHYPSSAIAGDAVYLPRHDGGLYAIDLKSHTLKWQLYLGDHALVGTSLPKNILPDSWPEIAWEPNVGKPIYASPAIASDGPIFIGTGEGYLYSIGNKRQK